MRGLPRVWRTAAAVACVMLLCVASVAGSYALSLYAINHGERDWCQALRILTAKRYYPPADPAKVPAQEAVYRLYVSLVQLEHDYRC